MTPQPFTQLRDPQSVVRTAVSVRRKDLWRFAASEETMQPPQYNMCIDGHMVQALVRIPCHRVVCNDGSIGGFFGKNDPSAAANKRALLEAEGVAFDASGRVEETFILRQL